MRLVFLRNATARILYYDMSIFPAILDTLLQTDTYHSTCLRKLQGIGEQIGQYLAQLILVEIHKQAFGLVVEIQTDILLLGKWHKLHRGILHKLVQTSTLQVQAFAVHLHLPEIEKLVHQLQQVACIPAHIVKLGTSLAIFGTLQDTSYRRDDKRKQGAEFMTDIGEEAVFHFLQLLVFFIFHTPAVLLHLPAESPYQNGYKE